MFNRYSAAAPTTTPTANRAINMGKLHMLLAGSGVGVVSVVGTGVGVGVGVGVAMGALMTVKRPASPGGLSFMVDWFPDTLMLIF